MCAENPVPVPGQRAAERDDGASSERGQDRGPTEWPNRARGLSGRRSGCNNNAGGEPLLSLLGSVGHIGQQSKWIYKLDKQQQKSIKIIKDCYDYCRVKLLGFKRDFSSVLDISQAL